MYSEKSYIDKANSAERKLIAWKESENITVAQQEIKKIPMRTSRDEEVANRALLLLSFKDTSIQNLKHVFNVLGIKTVEEKRKILKVIFHFIREGIIYIPKGLPNLIDKGVLIDLNNPAEESIEIHLLRPFDELIKEIQEEIISLYVGEK